MPHPSRKLIARPEGPDWTDPTTVRATARLEMARRGIEERYRRDPWAFLTEAVFTLDQITGQTRPFPPKAHLEFLTRLWATTSDGSDLHYPPVPLEGAAHPLLAIPKSRRMMVTWLFVALHYWLARYTPGAKIALLARKEGANEAQGSAELVWRARFIHDHLPPLLERRAVEYTFCRLVFPDTQSEILGIAQGSDQLRQMTLTAIFADEMAFWEQALETYVALRPTVEGGGRLVCVSSANPGFFEHLVFDGRVAGG